MVDLPQHFVEIQHHLNKMHKPLMECPFARADEHGTTCFGRPDSVGVFIAQNARMPGSSASQHLNFPPLENSNPAQTDFNRQCAMACLAV